MLRDGFSTREVLELTGSTARQLQWWDEKRIIVPARDGRRRIYSAEDVIQIHVIEELRRRGISLTAVRRVLRFLRRETGIALSDLAVGNSEFHLLLDGKNLYLETDSGQIVNLIRNTYQPVFVICLSEAARRVMEAPPVKQSSMPNGGSKVCSRSEKNNTHRKITFKEGDEGARRLRPNRAARPQRIATAIDGNVHQHEDTRGG